MPYRIKARNAMGETVTRMDQNLNARVIMNREEAEAIAQSFAETRGHGGPWTGFVEYYETSIAAIQPPERIARTIPKGHVRVNIDPQ